jgi:hypothetical protein
MGKGTVLGKRDTTFHKVINYLENYFSDRQKAG